MISKSLKKQWVKALRSGKYKKGQGWLCKKPESGKGQLQYCCLGVLAREMKILKKSPSGSYHVMVNSRDKEKSDTDLLGLKGGDGKLLLPTKIQNRLMKMNDAEVIDKVGERMKDKYTFNDIADWIDKHVNP